MGSVDGRFLLRDLALAEERLKAVRETILKMEKKDGTISVRAVIQVGEVSKEVEQLYQEVVAS